MPTTWLGEDGVRVEVPDLYAAVPDLQSAQVPLVAAVTPWTWPEAFRPSLTVATAQATPERCSLEQHLALTIAEQLALGVHVVAVDLYPLGEEQGVRVTGVFAGLGDTIVQLQWLAVRAGTLITLGLQQPAGTYAAADTVFRHAVTTLQVPAGSTLVEPDPATLPRLDAFAGSRGVELVDLSRVAAAEPWQGAGLVLGVEQLAGLHEGRIPRADADDALVQAGLCDHRGRLAEAGKLLHTTLERPARALVLEATGGTGERATLHAYLRATGAAVVATPPPGVVGAEGYTVGLVPAASVVVDLVRWLGLAPAWTFSLASGADGDLPLPAEQLDARIGDPAAPVPDGADEAGARMWAAPWTLVTVRGSDDPDGVALVRTDDAGWFLLDAPGSGTARITPLPSQQLLRMLVRFVGLEDAG